MAKKKIDPEKFYSPKDIIGLGIDFGVTRAKSDYTKHQMVLRHIRDGRIPSQNVGGSKMPRYIVQGKHLIEYNKAQMKPGEYATR